MERCDACIRYSIVQLQYCTSTSQYTRLLTSFTRPVFVSPVDTKSNQPGTTLMHVIVELAMRNPDLLSFGDDLTYLDSALKGMLRFDTSTVLHMYSSSTISTPALGIARIRVLCLCMHLYSNNVLTLIPQS